MTLRPRGPSVTFTASARLLTPRRIACRESSPCVICLDMMGYLRTAVVFHPNEIRRFLCCGRAWSATNAPQARMLGRRRAKATHDSAQAERENAEADDCQDEGHCSRRRTERHGANSHGSQWDRNRTLV